MSIKPDGWIRRMAHERGMIEPYVDRQERQGVISFGVSSYGYDIRVADDFMIFTNVNNAIVDPKNFDPKSFVEFKGEVCLIPPNSFALARSIEYLRVPLNVLGVVLGKSTYARCFRGDTRVALIDGSAPTLEEMATRAEAGERFWGYSLNPAGHVIVAQLEYPRYIGRDSLLEIVLDNEQAIHCTPDHEFIRRTGIRAAAHTLRPGDSLMPLYRSLYRGHEMVYQPPLGHCEPLYGLMEGWLTRNRTSGGEGESPHLRGVEAAGTWATPSAPLLHPAPREARNHKIQTIRELVGDHDVYCLTVPETGNFALDAGVFVRNCGIITNFTPLEPGWEGHITIEISNTTPLPAKIYANEGIAQVLFFESDEPCERSYADKQGKYQGQTGITLPRL